MKYVIPFMDDLTEYEEGKMAGLRLRFAGGRYVSSGEMLRTVDRLYEVIEGLRQHNAELEEELKGVYRDEWRRRN